MERKMTDKDKLYIAALLHDIGKFIERSKDESWKNDAKKYVTRKDVSSGYAHRRYSALFVEDHLKLEGYNESELNSISEFVLHHHNDNPKEVEKYLSIDNRGVPQKIIRIADDLASSERKKDETLESLTYYLANLESPFNDIIITDEQGNVKRKKEKDYLPTVKLSLDKSCQKPIKENEAKDNQYIKLVADFLEEIKNVESETALLAIMEKYLTNVPAQSPKEFNNEKYPFKADINLYDHSRAVAAIAVVLYEEYLNGSYKKNDKEICSKEYKTLLESISKPAILVCGNVNGIQDFIFDVKSKRAAKSLKGRSYFVQLLTEVVSKYIIDQWGLKEANILYNGGGNFFILAPNFRKKDIEQIQKDIALNLINTKLYLSLGVTDVSFEDFENFGNAFALAVENSNKSKKEKYKGLKKENIFEPFQQILKGESKFDELAVTLQKPTTHYYIGPKSKDETIQPKWEEIFRKFGYQVSPREKPFEKQGSVFNNLDFAEEFSSFKLAVRDLPLWNKTLKKKFEEEYNKEKSIFEFNNEDGEGINNIVSFKRLAELAKFDTGTEKLGVLKMDIDNLGKIFSGGLENPTIGRVASLSRTLKWFFEGYMNTLLQDDDFRDRIYPIFSGGDDFFVVGAWNKIFEFAIKVKKEFQEFVGNHPGITLSASLLVIDEKYPIIQIAHIAEERLEDAKNRREIKTNSKLKNAVSIFNTVLSWEDLYKAKELKNNIVEIIKLTKGNRAIINKILKSSSGFAAIQKEALFNKIIKTYKVWRLNYYLRDLVNYGKKENKEEIKSLTNKIIEQYEELFFEAFKGNKTSIQIFPVAARWAELETRNKIGDK